MDTKTKYDNIIIGFGKGGKTLAGYLASKGQSTALIEKDPAMYGGTCINVACIPSKSLEYSARMSAAEGGSFDDKASRYTEAVSRKRQLTGMLRKKNYDKVVSSGADVLDGEASFIDPHRVKVVSKDGTSAELYGERVFINTGSRPFIPPIAGADESKYVYTSESMMELDDLPRRLVIIGGGYIGLEFASYYNNFGSEVTIIQDGEAFIPREDTEVASSVYDHLLSKGIKILRSASTEKIHDENGHAELTLKMNEKTEKIDADAILIAAGRRPNIGSLNVEAAGIELTDRGAIKVDEHMRTSVPSIFAMGDVAGGLQFTYISLDDFRIVRSALEEDDKRTSSDRGAVPYTVFLDPPLSRVGLSEKEAIDQGYNIKTTKLPAAAIPKAHVTRDPAGMLKAVIDADTGLILGAHFFCAESQEMINIIKLCIDNKLPYTMLRDSIFNHPTMSESLNDLFNC